jgi:hypothetical protein
VSQIDPDFSAFAAMRALRDQLRERLDQSEDYRAWMALDEALRQLEPGLPRAADFTFDARGPILGNSQQMNSSRRSSVL